VGDVSVDGTYIIECIINRGSPNETRKTAALCRTSGLVIPGPVGDLALRKLGGMETFEDTSVTDLLAGWSTQVNRWLEYIKANPGGGGGVSWRSVRPRDQGGAFFTSQTRVNFAGLNHVATSGYYNGAANPAFFGNGTLGASTWAFAVPEFFHQAGNVVRLLNFGTGGMSGLGNCRLGIYANGSLASGVLAGSPYPGQLLASGAAFNSASGGIAVGGGGRIYETLLSLGVEEGDVLWFILFLDQFGRNGTQAALYNRAVPPFLGQTLGAATANLDIATTGIGYQHVIASNPFTGALPDPFPQSAPIVVVNGADGTAAAIPAIGFGFQAS
jgi:hypothetical protein